MELIDGKQTAATIKAEIKKEVEDIVSKGGKRPHLAAILVGHDGGSETYVRNKVLACEACGFQSTLLRFEDDITEEQLLQEVDKLNKDASVDGFIVQLPLPKHISEHQRAESHRSHRLQERCGWFPSHQRWKNGNRSALLHKRDTKRHLRAASPL